MPTVEIVLDFLSCVELGRCSEHEFEDSTQTSN